MADPVEVEEVVVEGKRKKPSLAARLKRTARFAVKDPDALARGAAELPGAVARGVKRYVQTATPGGVLADLGALGKQVVEDAVENPLETAAGMLPFVGSAMSAYDTAKAREAAADARARGDDATADRMEQLAAAGGAMLLLGALPGGRAVGKGAMRLAEEGALREARKLTETGLYSHAAEVARSLPQAKGTPEQIRAMLLKGGTKPDELRWSGFDEKFSGRPSVTRDEVAQHFEENVPRFEEVQYGPTNKQSAMHRWGAGLEGDMDGETLVVSVPDQEFVWHEDGREENTPGYSEILLKYAEPVREVLDYDAPKRIGEDGRLRRIVRQGPRYGYTDNPHWGEDDVAAHLRLIDRYLPERDAKTLHVEELQSDWAQQGRKEGFFKDGQPYRVFNPETGETLGTYRDYRAAVDAAEPLRGYAEVDKLYAPEAPHVMKTDAWVDLGVKRALREAALRDRPFFTWTPGAEQARRYGLGAERAAGQREFYDRLVPKRINEVLKPFGVRPEMDMFTLNRNAPGASGNLLMERYNLAPPEDYDRYWRGLAQDERDDLIARYYNEAGTLEVPGFGLDEKLRRRILEEGFKAYAKGGAVET